MMGSRLNYFRWVAPLFAVMWALSGCEYEWHLSINSLDKNGNPTFCVSASPGCSRPGVRVSVFDVLEVPPKGTERPYRTVWSIGPMSKEATLKEVTYGVPPPGYKEEMAAESLQVGRVYQIGGYRFRLSYKENNLTYEFGPFDQIQALPEH
jgi:hypothetical protein